MNLSRFLSPESSPERPGFGPQAVTNLSRSRANLSRDPSPTCPQAKRDGQPPSIETGCPLAASDVFTDSCACVGQSDSGQ